MPPFAAGRAPPGAAGHPATSDASSSLATLDRRAGRAPLSARSETVTAGAKMPAQQQRQVSIKAVARDGHDCSTPKRSYRPPWPLRTIAGSVVASGDAAAFLLAAPGFLANGGVVLPAAAFAAVPSDGPWTDKSTQDVNDTFTNVRFSVAAGGATMKNVTFKGNWDCNPSRPNRVGDQALTLMAPGITVPRSGKFNVVDPVDIHVKASFSKAPVTGHGKMSTEDKFTSAKAGVITFNSRIVFSKADGALYATCRSLSARSLTLNVSRFG